MSKGVSSASSLFLLSTSFISIIFPLARWHRHHPALIPQQPPPSTPSKQGELMASKEASEIDTVEQLYHTAQHYIGQVLQLLESTVTEDRHLQYSSDRSAGGTLGKHLRHLHDHYRLLLDAIPADSSSSSSNSEPLHVNYDIRIRNGDAENHHQACVDSFKHLSERLKRETKSGRGIPANRKILLEAITPDKVLLETTFGRELWFVSFHAVHHFAVLTPLLHEQGLKGPDGFGVAPSTLVHRHELTPNKL
ncbi:uncharacterized protein JCM6883_002237 [Sporobolomyces salmoneus]|uniref:uncharacterized protein n=1 Tax=Sporobolomyces salmoneus TaxID=183962 RepID=UPI003175C7A2